MTTRTILRVTLHWHIRKGRRLFELLASRLRAPFPGVYRPGNTGVRWG